MLKQPARGQMLKALFLLFIVGLILGTFRYGSVLSSAKKPVPIQGSYSVTLKADVKDPSLTDVYLDTSTSTQKFFITLSDVDIQQYHAAEFVNGSLYIIRPTGGSEGYKIYPNWTDELWKYGSNGVGKKIYSFRGIDFRVAPDMGDIGLIAGSYPDEAVVLLDPNGKMLKMFSRSDLGLSVTDFAVDPLSWGNGNFWVTASEGRLLEQLISINSADFSISRIDVSSLNITDPEFAFDPQSRAFAFSDYDAPLDIQDLNNPPHQTASLYLYDLATGAKKKLLTASITRGFYPAWLDPTTLEYNDPNGTGRLTMKISR